MVHASKIVDPEFQVVNQNKSKVTMPASFLNNQSAGTVASNERSLIKRSWVRAQYDYAPKVLTIVAPMVVPLWPSLITNMCGVWVPSEPVWDFFKNNLVLTLEVGSS